MFGIEDPGIWLAYLLGFGCLIFSLWYGYAYWNEQDSDEPEDTNDKEA